MILHSALAQRGWYPTRGLALRDWMAGIALGSRVTWPQITGVIMPHAGYAYSGKTAMQVMAQLVGRTYSRIIILGPSHFVRLKDQLVIPMGTGLETPLGVAQWDLAALAQLRMSPGVVQVPSVDEQEHSVQIEVPFFQAFFPGVPLVPLVVGELTPKGFDRMATLLDQICEPGTLLVVSSDFTHYGQNFRYIPFEDRVPDRIQSLDFEVIEALESGDFDAISTRFSEKQRTICGEVPIRLMMHVLSGQRGLCVDYELSGITTGDFTNCVAYSGMIFGGNHD